MTSLFQTALSAFDVAVVRLVQGLSDGRARPPEERLRQLEEAQRAYAAIAPEQFFAAPPPLTTVQQKRVRDLPLGGECADLTWESGWRPHEPLGREAYLQHAENRVAHARHLRHARPSPTVVCLHGYRAGMPRFEELAWRAAGLYRRGFDVALMTLPFHASRAPRGQAALFPSARVGRTIEGFGQAIWDLRGLLGWLRARGAPKAGLAGMSLGGYTAALAATVEPRLDFAVLFIPLGDLTDVAAEHEALRGRTIPEPLLAAGRAALSLVRPLSRTPLLAGDRMLVLAAEADRITSPRTHAEKLAAHFQAPLLTFPGGHLLQVGRGTAFAAMQDLLDRAALR